jgi:hypothetical protein
MQEACGPNLWLTSGRRARVITQWVRAAPAAQVQGAAPAAVAMRGPSSLLALAGEQGAGSRIAAEQLLAYNTWVMRSRFLNTTLAVSLGLHAALLGALALTASKLPPFPTGPLRVQILPAPEVGQSAPVPAIPGPAPVPPSRGVTREPAGRSGDAPRRGARILEERIERDGRDVTPDGPLLARPPSPRPRRRTSPSSRGWTRPPRSRRAPRRRPCRPSPPRGGISRFRVSLCRAAA